jgi:hypothetical protein
VPTYVAPDRSTFQAADLIGGVPIDPVLPPDFDNTPNERRPKSHTKWWRVPYVVTHPARNAIEPNVSVRKCDVRCLDGGAWDRSTWWGSFDTIVEAVAYAHGRAAPTYFAILLEDGREDPLL